MILASFTSSASLLFVLSAISAELFYYVVLNPIDFCIFSQCLNILIIN